MMLSRDDMQHLNAAKGWLELGSHLDANAELEEITAAERGRPEVLEVRFRIYGLAGRFEEAVIVLQSLLVLKPGGRIQGFYDLAVYACSHNRIDEACKFLGESLANAPEFLKRKALDDERLIKAWVEGNQ